MISYFKNVKSKPSKRRKRIRQKSDKQLLKDAAMALVRQIVFLRDGSKCLRCGATENLQNSHIYSQGAQPGMALEPENCKVLCKKCHLFWWHKNIPEAWAWIETVLPKERLVRLKMMSMQSRRGIDIKLQILWLKQELKKYDKP